MSRHRAPAATFDYLRPRLIFAGLLLGVLIAASQTAGLIG